MDTAQPDSKRNSFVKQASILAMAGLLVRLIGFFYRVPLLNILGDRGIAAYGAGYGIYNFLLILSSAGLPVAISKMIAERQAVGQHAGAYKVFKVSLLVSTALGLVAALLLWFGAEWFAAFTNVPESHYAILTLAPTVFMVAIMAVFRGYFQGQNNTLPTGISQIIEQIFNAVFSVWLAYVFISQSLMAGAAGGTSGTGIGAFAGLVLLVFMFFISRRKTRKKVKADANKSRESSLSIAKILLKTAFPIIIGTAIYSFTNIIDTAMVRGGLEPIKGTDESLRLFGLLNGKFVLLTTMPMSIATAFSTAVVPNIAASWKLKEYDAVRAKTGTALKITMLISMPAAFGMGLLADPIVRMLFPQHPDGGYLITVGFMAIVFFAVSQICTGILQGIGKLYVPVIGAVAGCAVKIALNYVLIPIPAINVVGAVISTIVCYAVAGGVNLYFVRKITRIKIDIGGTFVKPLVAAIIMGGVCWLLHFTFEGIIGNILAVLFTIAVGVVVYLASLVLLKGLTRADLSVMPFGGKILKVLGCFIREEA